MSTQVLERLVHIQYTSHIYNAIIYWVLVVKKIFCTGSVVKGACHPACGGREKTGLHECRSKNCKAMVDNRDKKIEAFSHYYLLCGFVNIRIQPSSLVLFLWRTWSLLFSWDESQHRLQGTFRFRRFDGGFKRNGNFSWCFYKARKKII